MSSRARAVDLAMVAMVLMIAACWSTSTPSAPSAPIEPVVKREPRPVAATCQDAGIGLERGTQALRAPEHTVAKAMADRCLEGAWPNDAIACFAAMRVGTENLGRCVALLPDQVRDSVFDELKGTDRASVAIALVKLNSMTIGIAACDQFVASVALVLGCDAMPLDMRVQLGVETSDFWSLPSKHLPPAAMQRMATVCQQSLDTLKREAATIGCL